MNKTDLIGSTAARAGVSKRIAEKCLAAAEESVYAALESGDKVRLYGFGMFEVRHIAAKVGRNPQTNEVVPIPPRKVPVFKAGAQLRARVSGTQRKASGG